MFECVWSDDFAFPDDLLVFINVMFLFYWNADCLYSHSRPNSKCFVISV